jgi:hypothetical protein
MNAGTRGSKREQLCKQPKDTLPSSGIANKSLLFTAANNINRFS